MPTPPSPTSPLGDDEIILRHIPAALDGPEVEPGNFELRKGEEYSSVCRVAITDARTLLSKLKTTTGSRVAAARVGDIRALGFRVEPKPSSRLPGHAGIFSDAASLNDDISRIDLADVFKYIDI